MNDDSHSITVTLSGAVSESVTVAAGATVDRPLPLSTDGSATLNWTSGDGVSYDLLYGNFCSGTATGQSAAVALLYGLPRQDLTLTPHADGCTGVVHVSTVHDTETMIGNQQFPPLLGASVFAHITIATALVPGLTYELPPIDGENYAINQFGLLPSPQSFTVEPNCGITVLPVPLIDWRVAVIGVALLLLVGAYWLRRRSASRS
ncbi:MAG TPA: hypothetical protein VJ831_00590 [Jatrophihabitantaceae bacterium]|nr:hypothetical protein [Jatrophihabitantaceae bacterium]